MQGCLCAENSPGICTTSAWTDQLWSTACQSTQLYKGSWSSSRSQDFPWFAGDRCGNFWHARCYVMTCGTTVTTYDTAAWVSVAGSSGWNIKKKKTQQNKPKCENSPPHSCINSNLNLHRRKGGWSGHFSNRYPVLFTYEMSLQLQLKGVTFQEKFILFSSIYLCKKSSKSSWYLQWLLLQI